MRALISGIKRMEIHDGDGLRTTVFFKGCPLKCIWCHNPESISFSKELAFFSEKCIGCNSCVDSCPVKVFENRIPPFSSCSFCLECVDACPTNALIAYGREYELRELLEVVLQDEEFFKNGQGGVTLSGGECLAQSDFVIAFAKALYKRGISVNIDTCGFVKREIFEEILPYVDTFLYDIKAYDGELHERFTGRSNGLILDNLRYLSSSGAKIEIRYPLVTGVNDGECEKIAKLLATHRITKVKVLRYHSFAGSRYEALGRENTMPKVSTENADIEKAIKIFEDHGVKAVSN